ncbi:MAG: PilZ domain-containing protein [Chloroflexota bacterium]
MASNQQILSDLRVVMEARHELELMNIYKGVPFICKAWIDRIDGEQAVLRAQGPSLVCLAAEKRTRVLGSDYFEPSQAQALSVDLQHNEIVLANFSYLGAHLGERMVVRVEPRADLAVWIDCEGRRATGQVADLSMSGMGVRFPINAYLPVLKPGASILAGLELPSGPVSLGGTVISSTRAADQYRISVRFVAEQAHRLAIFHYLVDRRAEIEQELAEEYERACRALE